MPGFWTQSVNPINTLQTCAGERVSVFLPVLARSRSLRPINNGRDEKLLQDFQAFLADPWTWIKANLELAGFVLLVLGALIGRFSGFFKWAFGKKDTGPTVIVQPTAPAPLNVPTSPVASPALEPGTLILTLDDYERRLEAEREKITVQIESSSGEERDRLQSRLQGLEAQLADTGQSYAEAQRRIKDLEAQLDRLGNQIGGDRLIEAKAALEALDYDKARVIFEEIEARSALEVETAAQAAYGLGQIAEADIRWHDAAAHYERAANLHPSTDNLNMAAQIAWKLGDYSEAERLARKGLEKAKTEENLKDEALWLGSLGLYVQLQGRNEEAEPLYRQAIEIDKATIGEAHPEYAKGLNNLAGLLQDMDRLEEAEPLYRQAIEIDKATIGEAHPDYAKDLINLAGLLKEMGRLDEARPLLSEALEIWKTSLGENHPEYLLSVWWTADFAKADNDYDGAKDAYATALDGYKNALGTDHPSTKNLAGQYGRLLVAHFPDDPALAVLRETFGPDIGKVKPQ